MVNKKIIKNKINKILLGHFNLIQMIYRKQKLYGRC